MARCERHDVPLIEEDDDEPFCPLCIGDDVDAQLAAGEDPGDHTQAMFGIPAKPETLRPLRASEAPAMGGPAAAEP